MDPKVVKSLQLLRDGNMVDFVEKIYNDERFTQLLMDLSSEYVDENVPVLDEDLKYDLALMMIETITVRSY